MTDLLPAIIERATAGFDADGYQAQFNADRLRSKEECFYHRVLTEQFDQPQAVLANVGRWSLD